MATKRAKILDDFQFEKLRMFIHDTSSTPERDDLLVLLSHKAGLRASEIAKIDMTALTDAEGRIARTITVYSHVGKKGKEREIPMHPLITDALIRFRYRYPRMEYPAFATKRGMYGKRMTPNAVVIWFHRLYKEAGLEGSSSHSGRRTWITKLARRANLYSASLVDVQRLAGHISLESTQRYIEPTEAVHGLVSST